MTQQSLLYFNRAEQKIKNLEQQLKEAHYKQETKQKEIAEQNLKLQQVNGFYLSIWILNIYMANIYKNIILNFDDNLCIAVMINDTCICKKYWPFVFV